MKQLELFDEPEYIAREDDYSGPHGDVREDFRELVAGVPAASGFWRCRRCHIPFEREKPCRHHMAGCDEEPWIDLTDEGKAMAVRLADALFKASRNIPDRMPDKPDTPEQRLADAAAEIALLEMLLADPQLSPKNRAILLAWNPVTAVNTFGEVPDIPIGPGVEVRHIVHTDHHLTFRKKDQEHEKRIWSNILGAFPRYGFAGWLVPAEIPNYRERFPTTYGKKGLEKVTGFPKRVKNYRLEELIERVNT